MTNRRSIAAKVPTEIRGFDDFRRASAEAQAGLIHELARAPRDPRRAALVPTELDDEAAHAFEEVSAGLRRAAIDAVLASAVSLGWVAEPDRYRRRLEEIFSFEEARTSGIVLPSDRGPWLVGYLFEVKLTGRLGPQRWVFSTYAGYGWRGTEPLAFIAGDRRPG